MDSMTAFKAHFPTLSDQETAAAITNPGVMDSVIGRAGVPDVFVLKFANGRGDLPPVVMTRYVAEMLHRLLQEQGF